MASPAYEIPPLRPWEEILDLDEPEILNEVCCEGCGDQDRDLDRYGLCAHCADRQGCQDAGDEQGHFEREND